jgi:4-hydroxybenzoate polyprenyltransferase
VPLLLLFPEQRPLWLASFRAPEPIHKATGLIWLYALFAFTSNLLREQIKDIEDADGDSACGCTTLPVLKGIRYARKPAGFTGVMLCVLVGLLLYFWISTGAPWWQVIAGALLLLAPAMAATWLVFRATAIRHYTIASWCIKGMMLAGIWLLLRPQ